MRLFENGKLVLARIFERPIESAPSDDDAAVSDERRQAERLRRAIDARRALDREVQRLERRQREELPRLCEATKKTEADAKRARKELSAAENAAAEARCAESGLDRSLREQIDRAHAELARTAWPWIFVVIEEAVERRRRFATHERGQLQTWHTQKVAVVPDPSDPDFRMMKSHGATYRMDRVGTNNAALDAAMAAMDKAVEDLRRLAWRVEEPSDEEVAALLVAFDDATWREAAGNFAWVEPSAPKYDAHGNRIAA